ncbi:MAG TPA: lysophospholipid acyltransferase family protein [Bryobacteraceae bacterium]|nr:lysophospholipid acyltransferase family protein [Bryobacteraceae bacterium]
MAQRSPFRNRLEYALARAALGSLAYGPRRLSYALAWCYAQVLRLAVPKLTRVARHNLEKTGMPAECAAGVWRSIARQLVVFARMGRIDATNVAEWIRYEGFEHFAKAKAAGKGVLFATLHLGAWELSAFSHALMAEPMHVVVRPLDNPLLDAFVEARRAASGNVILGKKEATRGIFQALKENRAVGILVDQNVGLDEGLFINFFGHKACVSPTFAKLAARTGAVVIPGYAIWSPDERKFVLRFDEPVGITGNTLIDTQRIQSALERAIRAYPDQWLWIHRRWKTRPPGEQPFY